MSDSVKKLNIISTAASLLGNDRASVHPEYSRAIAELVNDLIGSGSYEDKESIEEVLWMIATD